MTQNIDRRSFLAATPAAVAAAATVPAAEKPTKANRRAGLPNDPSDGRVAVLLFALRDCANDWHEATDAGGYKEHYDEDDDGLEERHREIAYALAHFANLYAGVVESDLRHYVDFEKKGGQLAALAAKTLKDRRPA